MDSNEKISIHGTNSQTFGQHGTTHADCDPNDEWNLSFLYYYNTFWNPAWGGDLRLYDSFQEGIDEEKNMLKNIVSEVLSLFRIVF